MYRGYYNVLIKHDIINNYNKSIKPYNLFIIVITRNIISSCIIILLSVKFIS